MVQLNNISERFQHWQLNEKILQVILSPSGGFRMEGQNQLLECLAVCLMSMVLSSSSRWPSVQELVPNTWGGPGSKAANMTCGRLSSVLVMR
jgi:hypothetical protein